MRLGSRIVFTCLLCAASFIIFLSSFGSQLISDVSEIELHGIANLENFVFLLGKDKRSTCSPGKIKAPKLLMLVHSAPQNRYRRDVIRKTWASLSKPKVIFLIGRSAEHQGDIDQEHSEHGDIVQGNFEDTYKNLSYKHLMGLAWAVAFCPDAKTILKVDDDTFVDTYRVIDVQETLNSLDNSIACAVFPRGSPPMRTGVRKVSFEEYPEGKPYPEYCSGMAYLTSPSVAEKLVKQSKHSRFFWVDDVYVTGILAAGCGVVRQNWIRWYSDVFQRDILGWLKDESHRKPVPYMFVEIRENQHDWTKIMKSLWNKTEQSWNHVNV